MSVSGQRVLQIFDELEKRLKSADKSTQLSEGRDDAQSKKKKSKLSARQK